jgi:hypothetical protein
VDPWEEFSTSQILRVFRLPASRSGEHNSGKSEAIAMPHCQRCGRYTRRLTYRRVNVGHRTDYYLYRLVCGRCASCHEAVNASLLSFPMLGTAGGFATWLFCFAPILYLFQAPPWLHIPAFLFSVAGGTLVAISIAPRNA